MQEVNMNREAIKRAIKSIKSEKDFKFVSGYHKTACGTAGDIAGHVVNSCVWDEQWRHRFFYTVDRVAREILNISSATANDLFHPEHNDADIYVNNPDEDSFIGKYRAIEALKMLHDTGILDWSNIPPEWKLKEEKLVKKAKQKRRMRKKMINALQTDNRCQRRRGNSRRRRRNSLAFTHKRKREKMFSEGKELTKKDKKKHGQLKELHHLLNNALDIVRQLETEHDVLTMYDAPALKKVDTLITKNVIPYIEGMIKRV